MNEHVEDRLSAWIDGELDSEQARAIEEHLARCPSCRELSRELTDLVRAARGLEHPMPPRDLWPDLEGALVVRGETGRAADRAATVALERDTTRGAWTGPRNAEIERLSERRTRRGRIRLSGWQALAAGLACAVLGGLGTAGLARAGLGMGARTPAPAAAPIAAPVLARATSAVDPSAELPQGLVAELRELEAALARAEDGLSPETMAVLRKNLDLIDRALADSRAALANDPSDAELRSHLETMAQRKVSLIRTAMRVNALPRVGP